MGDTVDDAVLGHASDFVRDQLSLERFGCRCRWGVETARDSEASGETRGVELLLDHPNVIGGSVALFEELDGPVAHDVGNDSIADALLKLCEWV